MANENRNHEDCESPILDQCREFYRNDPIWTPRTHYYPFNTRPQPLHTFVLDEDVIPTLEEKPDIVHLKETGAVFANERGTMSIKLHSTMCIDISIDMSIRIIDLKNNIVMALSATGSSAVLFHPMGRIYQVGDQINILAYGHGGNNKYGNMGANGIIFTTEFCPLVYQIDSAGTRTRFHSFINMTRDLSIHVFYYQTRHGPAFQQEAISLLQNAFFIVNQENIRTWTIKDITVTTEPDGSLRVNRNGDEYCLHISPKGSATITTPSLHATASLGWNSHLFVRRKDQSIYYDGANFTVRNAGHSAGFDARDKLKLFTY